MGIKINCHCGTCAPAEEFTIDLDDYCKRIPTEATTDEVEEAMGILQDEFTAVDLFDDGHRNNHAVNISIALHVLGYDPMEWFSNFALQQARIYHRWYPQDLAIAEEHFERIAPYVTGWGPQGAEGQALRFVV